MKTDGKNDDEVRAKAEALLKQVRAGADFAGLARKNSEDEGSAKQGGDLDYFGRGKMVKEFEDVAFTQAPGTISDLVKSQFGYHIIKVVDKKAATTRPLEQVRAQITDQMAYERAQEQATQIANTLGKQIKTGSDLDAAASSQGLKVQESGFFSHDEPIMNIGPAPNITERAFTLAVNAVDGPMRVARGQVFFTTVGSQPSRLPTLAEVKEKVHDDVLREKAKDLSRARADALAADFKADFTKAAKTAGLEVKTTELVARGSTLPEVGNSPAVDAAVFGLPAGAVTAPIVTDTGTVIVHVVERQDPKPEELKSGMETLRTEIVGERRGRFFTAYMQKAREQLKADINEDTLRRVVG